MQYTINDIHTLEKFLYQRYCYDHNMTFFPEHNCYHLRMITHFYNVIMYEAVLVTPHGKKSHSGYVCNTPEAAIAFVIMAEMGEWNSAWELYQTKGKGQDAIIARAMELLLQEEERVNQPKTPPNDIKFMRMLAEAWNKNIKQDNTSTINQ